MLPLPQIRAIAERVATSEGLEVLEVDLRGGKPAMLRVVIDKREGVTHTDCETVSRQMSAILDVEDLIPNRYTLEVSSPGAERKLSGAADFERFTGKLAKVVLKQALGEDAGNLKGQGSVQGRIESCREGILTLEVAVRKGVLKPFAVPVENIARANLVLEW